MCPDPKILSVYFDGELSEDRSALLEEHLSSCPVCRSTLEYFSSQRSMLQSDSPVPSPGADNLQRFWHYMSVQRLRSSHPVRRSISMPLPLALAAVLILAVSLFFNVLGRVGDSSFMAAEPDSPLSTVLHVAVTPGELDEVFTILENSRGYGDAMHTLPDELSVIQLGDPLLFVEGAH